MTKFAKFASLILLLQLNRAILGLLLLLPIPEGTAIDTCIGVLNQSQKTMPETVFEV